MLRRFLLLVLGASVAACSGEAAPIGEGGEGQTVQVVVAPLELTGIVDAAYTITVTNAGGQTVWSQAGLTSKQFGDGGGSLSYVGPCDAMSNPNTVTIEIDSLSDREGPILASEWRDPSPVFRKIECLENRDALVEFNLVIMRSADQGFFDIAVSFEDVFCSAKLDCLGANLLHNPASGERDTTVVFAFACAGGQGQETTLYLDDITITCQGGVTYAINPALGPGNQGGQPPLLFQVATYWGQEQLGGGTLDKCYWNTAIGIDLAQLVPVDASCVLTATGTATSEPFLDNASPDDVRWPVIEWTVPLTDGTGTLICGDNPLDGDGSGVITDYTEQAGDVFDHVYHCGEAPGVLRCAGDAALLDGQALAFAEAPGGFTVNVGGAASRVFPLPPGHRLTRCCVDGCCDSEAAPMR